MQTQLRKSSLILLNVSIVCVLSALVGSVTNAQIAIAVKGTPKIDGQVDEVWSKAVPIRVNRPVIELTQVEIPSAAVANARVLWDESKLYLLIEVLDSERSAAAPQSWEQDSVEVFFDEMLERAVAFDTNDRQIRVNFEGALSGGGTFRPDVVDAKTLETEDGYRVEMSVVPEHAQLEAGAKLGFELQVNDDPGLGVRRAVMKWHHADNESWRNTENFGTLALFDRWEGDMSVMLGGARVASAEPAKENNEEPPQPALTLEQRVPAWAADAIFYQVFPERFRNGDPSNDPTRESLEDPQTVPDSWNVTRWTSDWYARAAWEQQMGENFYENGVFHRRYGGDLQGVLEKLDYLAELGINTIYLNPVFYARSLHKYDGNTYHHVDPYFGPSPEADLKQMSDETSDPATWKWTAADKLFLRLIKKAHSLDLRVIVDGVFNHTGRDFFAFNDLRKNQADSPYVNWYVVESFDDPNTPDNEFKYQCWWGVETLPEFANSTDGQDLHEGPKKYIFDSTRRWMDPNGDGDPSDGIDGWRLDVANEVPDQFWVDWHRHVHAINTDAMTVAEVWDDASQYLERCGFSSTMNYHGFAFLVKGFLIDGSMTPSAFASALDQRALQHPGRVRYALQNLIDSHDTDRVASMIVNARPEDYVKPERFDYDIGERASPRHDMDYQIQKPTDSQREIQRLVALFQMTYVGAPMIYYGTEAGMWGGDDPCDRKPMIWDDLIHDDETSDPRERTAAAEKGAEAPRADKVEFDETLFKFYKSLTTLRADHPALRRGKFRVVSADDSSNSLVFQRQFEQDNMLVFINRSHTDQEITVDLTGNKLPSHWDLSLKTADALEFSTSKDGYREVLIVKLPPRAGGVMEAVAE